MSLSLSLATKGLIFNSGSLATRGAILPKEEEVAVSERKAFVSDLAKFDTVRVAISPAYSVSKKVTKNGTRLSVKKGNLSRAYDRSIFDGMVLTNSPKNGKLSIQTTVQGEEIVFTVPYHSIRFILLAEQFVELKSSATSPGTVARGVLFPGGWLMPPRFKFTRLKI